MQALKKQIKEKKINGIYLFYGEEKYVLNAYLDRLIDTALIDSDQSMNLDIFESPSIEVDKVADALETLPFFSDKRVVVLKEVDLFKTKNATKTEKLVQALEKIPASTVCIIIEDEIDKRSKYYKKLQNLSHVVEFKTLAEEDLLHYIAEQLNKYGMRIEASVAKYFIHVVGFDLTTIQNELKKLVDFSLNETVIRSEAIDQICVRSIENRIFELVDCIGTRKRERAMQLYRDLIMLKEPPTRILFMITRQFRMILQTKILLEQKSERQYMISKLKVAPFIMDKNIRQAHYFSIIQLKQALKKCLDTEAEMKSGKMDLELGLELLIIHYSY